MDYFLGEPGLSSDSSDFVIEYTPHTSFRLLALKELSHALVLSLHWNVRFKLLLCLELSLPDYKNIIVCDAFLLQDLPARCLLGFGAQHERLELLLEPVREERNSQHERDSLINIATYHDLCNTFNNFI